MCKILRQQKVIQKFVYYLVSKNFVSYDLDKRFDKNSPYNIEGNSNRSVVTF